MLVAARRGLTAHVAASGVMRELRNRMFQSGSEATGFIGTHWLYEGIDPDRPFD